MTEYEAIQMGLADLMSGHTLTYEEVFGEPLFIDPPWTMFDILLYGTLGFLVAVILVVM